MKDNEAVSKALQGVGVGCAARPDGSSVLVFADGTMLAARSLRMLTAHEAERLRDAGTRHLASEAATLAALGGKHVAHDQTIHVTKSDVTPGDFPKPGETLDMDWSTGRRRS